MLIYFFTLGCAFLRSKPLHYCIINNTRPFPDVERKIANSAVSKSEISQKQEFRRVESYLFYHLPYFTLSQPEAGFGQNDESDSTRSSPAVAYVAAVAVHRPISTPSMRCR